MNSNNPTVGTSANQHALNDPALSNPTMNNTAVHDSMMNQHAINQQTAITGPGKSAGQSVGESAGGAIQKGWHKLHVGHSRHAPRRRLTSF
jgi:hypothetical protein